MADDPPRSKNGIPIADELAEKLADEAERGYDLGSGSQITRKGLKIPGQHEDKSPA